MIQQMNFILRIQKNDYVKNFLIESRNLMNNSGMIGRLLQISGWQPNIKLEKLNALILEKISDLARNKMDVYCFNEKVQKVKKILLLRNNFLRTIKLNELLHYTTYQVEQNKSNELDTNDIMET